MNQATAISTAGQAAGAPSTAPAPEPTRTAIEASQVRCVYGLGGPHPTDALGPMDLTVRSGEFLSIVGPSGCGKSTFVKVVAGLVDPTHGSMRIALEGRSDTPIATVFQDFGIFPWKTVLANVAFGLRVRGTSRREARSRATDALKRLGLGGFLDSYPTELSGGMRQRVAIARALVVEPEILLMDEPFASLDAQLREIMQDELVRLCEQDRRTVLFVTHSLEEAIVLGDRVVVMTARPGRIVADKAVPFGRPRAMHVRETPEFAAMRLELWELLRSEVDEQLASTEGKEGAS